jgi:hypothetical protein
LEPGTWNLELQFRVARRGGWTPFGLRIGQQLVTSHQSRFTTLPGSLHSALSPGHIYPSVHYPMR